jgi:uncharacterized membrane protein/protein-disulfide isomerase
VHVGGIVRKGIISILIIIGIVISCMLVAQHTRLASGLQDQPSFCSFSEVFDCDAVAKSRYSEFLGIPVASFALVYFISLFALVLISSLTTKVSEHSFLSILLFLSFLSMFDSIYFMYISFFVLQKICLNCLILYFVNISLFVIATVSCVRHQTFLNSLLQGGKQVLSFFIFSFIPSRTSFFQASMFVWLILIAGLVYLMPEMLVRYVFTSPILHNSQLPPLTEIAYEQWKSAKPSKLNIITNADVWERDFSIGEDSAQIRAVLFSDFQCPYCSKASKIFYGHYLNHPDKIQIIFKNYPLDSSCNPAISSSFHPYACKAALFARCAGVVDEDLFWEMHDEIYEIQEFSPQALDSLPRKVGVAGETFDECIRDVSMQERIARDITEGNKLNLQGTPAIFINNKFLSRPYAETIDMIIGSLLK